MSRPIRQIGIVTLANHAAAGFTATTNYDQKVPIEAIGLALFVEATDDAGTSPTLDIKVQHKPPLSSTYVDLPGASFAQITTTDVRKRLVVYPGVAETNNESVSDVISAHDIRVVATLGGSDTPTYALKLSLAWLG